VELYITLGHAVAQLVEALRYKPDTSQVRVFGIFHWLNSSCRTTALRSTRPLTEMSIGGGGGGVRGDDNLTPWHPQSPEALRVCPGL
jgi:hypothetical protein